MILKRTYSYLAVLLIFTLLVIACGDPGIPVTGPVDDPNGEEQEDPALRAQEEWERRNEELKEELGPYYVPLPPLEQPANPPVKVRGIFLTGHTVGSKSRLHNLLELIDKTEINAMVIDIKDDKGRMSYHSEIEMVNELDAYYKPVPINDIRSTLDDLHERGIYTIARIVVYKDLEILPNQRPEWCIPLNDGGLYKDRGGFAYGNPFIEDLWDYNIAIAKEAALLGFREIQFDYIRFPDNAAYIDRVAYFPGRDEKPKAEAIAGFVRRAQKELAPYNVYISHDPFGVVASSWGDHEDIGQIWEDFATNCDYICPMIYPCHYGPGWFGYSVPNAEPGGVITAALSDALKRNAPLEEPAVIRPWLKSWGNYGPVEIRAQIDAALNLGIEEYILWNASNVYPAAAFFTEAEANQRAAAIQEQRESEGRDYLNRTARQAAESYLEAIQKKRWREAYALQRTGKSGGYEEGNNFRDWLNGSNGRLTEWEIRGAVPAGNAVIIGLNVTVTLRGEAITLTEETWTLVRENGVWRIRPSIAFLELIEGRESGEQG